MTGNGAEALLTTLVGSGVEVCFANPGTSEMHFVAALDSVAGMRAVLCLFEGVATGAADGYARMTGRPAATLLHLGPGLGNGIANLHNARRAGSPVVNVVGDHATHHKPFDAPLESDIDALAGAVSGWVRRSGTVAEVGADAAAAVTAASDGPSPDDPVLAGGRVATLILPADVSWSDGATPGVAAVPAGPTRVPDPAVAAVATQLQRDARATILLGGTALTEAGLRAASRIAAATGATVLAETFPARLRRGAGIPAVDRLAYREEDAVRQLAGTEVMVLAGASAPVAFFAYPGRPSTFTPPGATTVTLADREADVVDALERLASQLGGVEVEVPTVPTPPVPTGALTAANWSAAVASVWPDAEAIVVDESNTSGMAALPAATAGCPPHDVLTLTGGAIGIGLPLAVGAAVARPDRPVLCLESDGSAMYTISALWTHAREHLDVTTVILDNRSYAILQHELDRVGAARGGKRAATLLDLSRPDLDFVALATGMGVPATRATTCEALAEQLRAAFTAPGPHLVVAQLNGAASNGRE